MDQYYHVGAEVLDKNGSLLGHVARITGQSDDTRIVVDIVDSNRALMFPYNVINHEESSEERLKLSIEHEELGEEMLGLGEHHREYLELVEEVLEAHVHEVVRGKVVVEKTVKSEPYREEIKLGEDSVTVERVVFGDILVKAPVVRTEGDTLIVPVVEEVLVVEKRYQLVEEVRITTHREVRTETIEDELRREHVTVSMVDLEGRSRNLE